MYEKQLKSTAPVKPRVNLQLPCSLLFPQTWCASSEGFTANLQTERVLVLCTVRHGKVLPTLGECASVHIELPMNQNFPPRYIKCDTTLLEIEAFGNQSYGFMMRIVNADFDDLGIGSMELSRLDPETCGYIM